MLVCLFYLDAVVVVVAVQNGNCCLISGIRLIYIIFKSDILPFSQHKYDYTKVINGGEVKVL